MVLTCRVTPNAETVTPDAWLYSGKIESVAIMNGVTPDGWQKPIEVGVKLYLEQGNLQFQPEILLSGNVKRNAAGEIEDWGGAFPVRDLLFNVAGYDGPIGEDLELPEAALKMLIGKTIHYVRYKSTKMKSDGSDNSVFTYKEVAATKDAMIGRWKKQVGKGYPKDYIHSPQAVGSGVPSGAPAPVF